MSMVFGIASFPMINMILGMIVGLILSLVFGAKGVFAGFAIVLLALPAGLATGIAALIKSNNRPAEFGGKGFAIAGIVLSGFAIIVIPIVAAIAVPNLLAARRAANEGSALAAIRTLAAAEETFIATVGAGRCGDISQLASGQLIDHELGSGQKNGYRFTLTKTATGCEVSAVPVTAKGVSASGVRSFYAANDESWAIHFADKNGLTADRRDPVLDTTGYGGSTYRPQTASQRSF